MSTKMLWNTVATRFVIRARFGKCTTGKLTNLKFPGGPTVPGLRSCVPKPVNLWAASANPCNGFLLLLCIVLSDPERGGAFTYQRADKMA